MRSLKHIQVIHMTKESSENDSDNSNSTMIGLTWPKPVKDKTKFVGQMQTVSPRLLQIYYLIFYLRCLHLMLVIKQPSLPLL
jgi:hypothetical protein